MEKTPIESLHKGFRRLAFSEDAQQSPCLTAGNSDAVNEFVKMVHERSDFFEEVSDPFGGTRDIIIGCRDRYGIPINTVLCLDTGMIRSTPYYTDEAIEIFYRDYYRGIYANSFGVPLAPKAHLVGKQIEKGVQILEKTAGSMKEGSRVLDYGCGIGGALIPFKEAGHSVLGLDYGKGYLNYGRSFGLDLLEGGLEQLEGQEPFELIILSHVLEHVKDPVQFLQGIKRWLAKDGLLYVEVPSLQWVHGIWNHDLLLHLQNAHVWYFTTNTLELLLSQVGLSSKTQFGRISIICEHSDKPPLVPEAGHGAKCLRYLKRNEWIATHRLTSSRPLKFVVQKLFDRFCDL